jgi:hypothetical protein
MRQSILLASTLLAIAAFAPASHASPLMPAGGIANVAAETDMVAQAHHRPGHHRHGRHYGWSRGHHYGWGHRHHRHRY